MDTILPSQPLSYGEIIKRSLRLYYLSFFKVFLLALILSIIIFIPRLIADMTGHDLFSNLPPFSLHRLWLILINLTGLAFFVAIIWHIYCVARQVHEPFIEDIVVGIKKCIYILIAAIIQNAIIFAVIAVIFGLQILLYQYHWLFSSSILSVIFTSLVFIGEFILLLYMTILFLFFTPLIAIENKGIFIAIEKSVLLAWNHWWRVFSLQVTPWICYLILLIIIKYGLRIDIHIYLGEQTQHPLWTSILNIIIFALFIPWVATLLLLQLKDLELRRELARK